MSAQATTAILSEIHGLLHEAKSNVELDPAKGQNLIDRLSSAESAQKSGTLSIEELSRIVSEVREAIAGPIEKELSIDNPDAAVLQIRELLNRLEK